MKLLVISSFLPYPLFSGGHVRLFNILKRLSKHYEITLICEKRDYQTQSDIEMVKKICKEVITVPRKKQWTVQNILKTAFSSYPFLMVGHANSEMALKIKESLVWGFDLIHIETFYVMQNLPKTQVPVILAEHNVEYLVYKRFSDKSFFFLKPFFYLDAAKMKFWEKRFWKAATKLVAVSKEEKKLMQREDTVIVANGVDLEKFTVNSSQLTANKEKTILFIGDFRWIQNVDSVTFLLKEIWPHFAKATRGKPKTKLWIVGKNIPDSIKQLSKDSQVIFDENTSLETHEIFQKADILLAPTRVGGGTSYKILEAMASGVPVVTTLLGIEGIEAKNNQEVLLGENKEDLASQVMRLFDDTDLYQKIAQNARKLIESAYDWEIIVGKLEKVYQAVTV